MSDVYLNHVTQLLDQIAADGMMKKEREITSPQGGEIAVGARSVINSNRELLLLLCC